MVKAEAQLEADLRALADDDMAARGFYALAQRRSRGDARAELWVPRVDFMLNADELHIAIDGVVIAGERALLASPSTMSEMLDTYVLPRLRENILMTLPREGESLHAPDAPEDPGLDILLRAYADVPTATMYPHGYERLPDGAVLAKSAAP